VNVVILAWRDAVESFLGSGSRLRRCSDGPAPLAVETRAEYNKSNDILGRSLPTIYGIFGGFSARRQLHAIDVEVAEEGA
jgi:hypothetical protein